LVEELSATIARIGRVWKNCELEKWWAFVL